MVESDSAFDDERETEPLLEAKGHWSVFLPALVIAALYGGIWAWFAIRGAHDGALARAALSICVIGGPVLFVYAFLRFNSTHVGLYADRVLIEQGWPHRREFSLSAEAIVDVETRYSPVGRLFGGGTLIVHSRGGGHHSVADLGAPDAVAGWMRTNYGLEAEN